MGRILLLLLLVSALVSPMIVYADSPTHVVAYGETLYSIARSYGVSPAALAAANGITIQSWVYAGQRLVIPITEDDSAAVSVAQASPGGMYVVRAGDTLLSVSRKFGVSVGAIADANDIPPNGFLYTGWQLKIPGSANHKQAARLFPTVSPLLKTIRARQITTQAVLRPQSRRPLISSLQAIPSMGLQ